METLIIEMFEKNILQTDKVLTESEFFEQVKGLVKVDSDLYKSYLDYFINY